MATQYTWTITNMFCYPIQDGYSDVVFSVSSVCTGIDIVDGISYENFILSSTQVKLNPDDPYIPYADLTQEIVLNWVWENLDKLAVEEKVDVLVKALINPTVIELPLPF